MPFERIGDDGFLHRLAGSYAVVVALGVLAGALLAPAVVGIVHPEPATVAVVPVEGALDGTTATAVTDELERARQDPAVEAVVLRINSPGGTAAASETTYLAVQRLAAETDLPVVVSVDATAASGAYYAAVPSDYVYVKPSSIVGSVGVLAPLPTKAEPNDVIGATGPNKLSSDSERAFYHKMETLKRAFVGAVLKHRGEALALDRAELAEAGTYTGARAVQIGVADGIGGLDRAVAKAARLADLTEYTVETFRTNVTVTFVSRASYLASDAPNKRLVSPTYLTGVGGNGTAYGTFLMIPPEYAVPARGAEVYNASG